MITGRLLCGDGAGGVSKQACRKARSAEQAQCWAGVRRQTFFSPAQSTFQPRDFRLPPRKLLACELAPDTAVRRVRPVATLVRKFVSLRKRGDICCFAMAK